MSSFYDEKGTMVSRLLGPSALRRGDLGRDQRLNASFCKTPGFHDGDQFFSTIPYVAGSHTYDMMIVKPIFYRRRVDRLDGHEHAHRGYRRRSCAARPMRFSTKGICVPGLKIVEKDEFREDVFQTLTGMCRDPQYVGLDLKAMIAGNNICAKRYLGLVEKFGLKFVQLAGEKMIEDSEDKSRAKLRIHARRHLGDAPVRHDLRSKDAKIRGAAALLHHDEKARRASLRFHRTRVRRPTRIITRPCRAPSLISRWR